jgi:hypothetical protein
LASSRFEKNPLPRGSLPGVENIRFRDKRGRYCQPPRAYSFEVLLPRHRVPLKGEIPKEYRRTIALRVQYVGEVLGEYSRRRFEAQAKRRRERVAREAKKVVKREKKIKERAKRGDRRAERELEREVKRQEEMDARQDAWLKREGVERRPPATPLASRLTAVETREDTRWDVVGRNLDEKLEQKLRNDAASGRRGQPRDTGVRDFQGRRMVLEKMHVDFPKGKQVEVFPFNVRGVSAAMKEFFLGYAEKFTDENRGKSEESYIIRLKTLNRIEGEKPQEQGVGIPRFRMPRRIDPSQRAYLRQVYKGLTDDEILRQIQKEALESQFDRLVKYFADRYEDYLGRRVVSSMAVTGFSMEVVKGIVG